MGQTTILLTTRFRALKNRFRDHGPGWWFATSLGILLIAAAIIGLGQLAAPFLVSLPADTLPGTDLALQQPPFKRGEPIPGARALDAAFWMTSLVASVLIFRVMELLFRRADIRAVENYPIQLRALFVDRAIATFAEAILAGLALSLFFLPLAWHLNASLFGLCAILCVAGLIAGSALTLVIQLFAGDSQVPDTNNAPQKDAAIRSTGDAYGGGGQIFLFAPALALAFVVVLLLFIKLFVGEHLITGHITRPFEIGMTSVFILTAVSLFTAYRYFTRAFPAMAARFREADFVVFNSYQPYQKSAFTHQNIFERALPQSARAMFRADLLQYGRRYMTSRYLYVFFWAAAAFAFYKFGDAAQLSELGRGLPAAIPALLLAALANPWRRIHNQRANAHTYLALPLSQHDLLTSSALFSAREAMLFTLPYAAIAFIIPLVSTGFTTANLMAAGSTAIAALTCALAVNGITALGVRLLGATSLLTSALPVLAAALLLVLGLASFPLLLIVSTLLLLLNFSAWMPHDRTAFA